MHHVQSSIALCREVGDDLGEYLSQSNLAAVLAELGHVREAIDAVEAKTSIRARTDPQPPAPPEQRRRRAHDPR